MYNTEFPILYNTLPHQGNRFHSTIHGKLPTCGDYSFCAFLFMCVVYLSLYRIMNIYSVSFLDKHLTKLKRINGVLHKCFRIVPTSTEQVYCIADKGVCIRGLSYTKISQLTHVCLSVFVSLVIDIIVLDEALIL